MTAMALANTARSSTAADSLLALPDEVFEYILIRLNLADIRNLRLCSGGLAAKTIQPHLKTFYQSKTLPLEKTALEDFTRITQYSGPGVTIGLGCMVQELTIVGQVHNSPTKGKGKRRTRTQGAALGDGEAVTLLTAGFRNLTAAGNRALRSVKLTVAEKRAKVPGNKFKDTYGRLSL